MLKTKSGDNWRTQLSLWGIPQEILDQAPENPWIHPAALFDLPEKIEITPSHQRAREVNPTSVLDIGCGGGVAAFATDAHQVIGVDHQSEMLDMFKSHADKRGRESKTVLGFWPEVADQVEKADVVVAHHVLYNVQNVEDFLLAMNSHATKRVVIEIPQQHPQSGASGLWKYFWNIERPTTPTSTDLLNVVKELGIDAHLELWDGTPRAMVDIEKEAEYDRIRLCLPQSRKSEVLEYMRSHSGTRNRPLATIWWDV